MVLFHPKRCLRKIVQWYEITVFRAYCQSHHIRCIIGDNTRIKHCRVKSKIDGVLIIGANCTLHGALFCFYGSGGRIELKDRVYINAYPWAKVSFYVKDSSTISIGSDCLFSNTIDIATTDWHRISDVKGNILNPEKDVNIGDHVWLGRKIIVCKGVSIPDNSVIGAGSVVTKSFDETNVIIAGNPAEIKKRGVRWKL